jgi:hypothetical protein
MSDLPSSIEQIDDRITIVRQNLQEMIEQAAAYSGAADEDLMQQRISEQQALLERLTKLRDELSRAKPKA